MYVPINKNGGVSNTQANVLNVPLTACFCPDRLPSGGIYIC
jgi:hypothetical protein